MDTTRINRPDYPQSGNIAPMAIIISIGLSTSEISWEHHPTLQYHPPRNHSRESGQRLAVFSTINSHLSLLREPTTHVLQFFSCLELKALSNYCHLLHTTTRFGKFSYTFKINKTIEIKMKQGKLLSTVLSEKYSITKTGKKRKARLLAL